MHDLGLLASAIDTEVEIDALHARVRGRIRQVFRGDVENDDFNRLVVAHACPPRRSTILRAYAKYLRQIGFPLSQAFIQSTLAGHGDVARELVELFKLRFDPAGDAGVGARTAEQVRAIEAALEGVDNLSEDRVLRQYLALIQATTRTNFWRFAMRRGPAQELPVLQIRSRQGAGAAGAQADVRDLRLFDALRGRAPARRQGRARRVALVGSTGGFPHRGAGPGQGADGQEYGHRPGRLEGRLRAQARAVRRPTARRTSRRASPATRIICAACSI